MTSFAMKTLAAIMLLLTATPAFAQDTCAIAGAQCGDSFPPCCGECTFMNDRYSECRDSAPPPTYSTVTQSETPPTYPGCVDVYKQCGGKNWTGARCCPEGTACVSVNEFYSQCRPPTTPPTTPPTNPPPTTPPTNPPPTNPPPTNPPPQTTEPAQTPPSRKCAELFGQCGGIVHMGPTCCDQGECVKKSAFYSQCVAVVQSPPVASGGCSGEWEQCGGKHWKGSTCCGAGLDCIRASEFYSQCISPESRKQHHYPKQPLDTNGCTGRFMQCGNEGYPKCCSGFNACVKQNEWYSQCLATKLPDNLIAWWGTCVEGGDKKCEPRSSCVALNKYAAVCVPDGISIAGSPPVYAGV